MNMTKKDRIVSIVLNSIVLLSATIGTVLSATAAAGSFMSGKVAFMYYTIQSNIAVALISAAFLVMLLRNQKISSTWYVIKFVGATAITLTGFVFLFILAPMLTGKFPVWTVYNVLTHVVVPFTFVADFFLTAAYGDIQKRHIPFILLPPIAYAIYAGIGYVAGWKFLKGNNYPYFFMNWGSPAGAIGFSSEQPFMGPVWWIIVLLGFMILMGFFYLWIVNKIKRKKMQQS